MSAILGLLGVGGGVLSTALLRWIGGKVLSRFGAGLLRRIGNAMVLQAEGDEPKPTKGE